jgi:hypothetical protein
LTQRAIDYIKPHDESMKPSALINAVLGITSYKNLVDQYQGKKLNVELVKNAIAKENNLTDSCAAICARAFEASLRFAAMLSSDGSVQTSPNPICPDRQNNGNSRESGGEEEHREEDEDTILLKDTQRHSLFLDKEKLRSFTFTGPLEISRSEYDRICKWLEYTMLIVDEQKVMTS